MSSVRAEAVIELGGLLVSQLDCDHDLLASWMAHYVAELIEAARTSPVVERRVAQERCAKAILELWKQRSSVPERVRPLIELEPILRTLAALDTDGGHVWYFKQVFEQLESGGADEHTKTCIALAADVDSTARTLILWLLRMATQRIASTTEPWMELAAAAGVDEDVDMSIIRAILEGDAKKSARARTKALKGKLSLLDVFVERATAFAKELRDELAGMEAVRTRERPKRRKRAKKPVI